MSKIVYFDNNATTQVAPEVRDAMAPFFGELYGNPSSMHAFGGQIAKYVAQAREQHLPAQVADDDRLPIIRVLVPPRKNEPVAVATVEALRRLEREVRPVRP